MFLRVCGICHTQFLTCSAVCGFLGWVLSPSSELHSRSAYQPHFSEQSDAATAVFFVHAESFFISNFEQLSVVLCVCVVFMELLGCVGLEFLSDLGF